MAAKKKSEIKIKKSKQGSLRKRLKVPADEPIPASKLNAAIKNGDADLKKKARFAKNAKKFKH